MNNIIIVYQDMLDCVSTHSSYFEGDKGRVLMVDGGW